MKTRHKCNIISELEVQFAKLGGNKIIWKKIK